MHFFPEGTDIGYAIEFSERLLKTNEKFQYICRKNGDAQSFLCKMDGSNCEIVGKFSLDCCFKFQLVS